MRVFLPLVAAAIFLTASADYLLFGHPLGCGVTAFAVILAAVLAARYRTRLLRALPWAALWLVLAFGASLQSSAIGVVLLLILTWAVLAAACLPGGPDIFDAMWTGAAGGVRGLAAIFADLGQKLTWGGAEKTRYAAKWVIGVPAVIIVIFASLIIPANLVLAKWTGDFLDDLVRWIKEINAARLFFWAAVFLEGYGLLRFRPWLTSPRGAARPAAMPATPPPPPPGVMIVPNPVTPEMKRRYESMAATVTFVGLNVLFLAANATDAGYLWLAFKLPTGLTYSQYAHAGAYRLIAAVVLAAVTVTAFFRIGAPQSESRRARILAYLFILQNAIVLLGAGRRLQLYVTVYGLTRFRVAAFLWMILVLAGFVTILWKLVAKKSFRFLVRANTVTVILLLSVVSLTDINGFIAGWNAARYQEDTRRTIDVAYLAGLGAPAMPALARLAKSEDRQVARMAEESLSVLIEKARDRDEFWQSRTIRGTRVLCETLEQADEAGIPDPD